LLQAIRITFMGDSMFLAYSHDPSSAMTNQLADHVLQSRVDESLVALREAWGAGEDHASILRGLEAASLNAFNHRFPNIHIPKELEYLLRFLDHVPESLRLDFLERFVEYVAWAPKYVSENSGVYTSGAGSSEDPLASYLDAMERGKGMGALFYVNEAADGDLHATFQSLLRVGCIDVSRSIGHFFSCTDSVLSLASQVGLPQARNHLFLLTMYFMQLRHFRVTEFREPEGDLDQILGELVKKGGFLEYHYVILIDGLIRRREFIGEEHYLHALARIEGLLPGMNETLTTRRLNSMIRGAETKSEPLEDLRRGILNADAPRAYAALRRQIKAEGMTPELEYTIAHTYTWIRGRPHDPHYVTFPVAVFELMKNLSDENLELAAAHTVEFALSRVKRHGIVEERAGYRNC
jgi:hypothetical protein